MKKLGILALFAVCCLVFVVSMVGCGTGGGGDATTTTTTSTTTTTLTAYHFVGTFEQNVCTYETIVVLLSKESNTAAFDILTFEAGSISFDITTSEAGNYLLYSLTPFDGNAAVYIGGYDIAVAGTPTDLIAQLVTIEAIGAFQSYDLGTMEMVRYLGN